MIYDYASRQFLRLNRFVSCKPFTRRPNPLNHSFPQNVHNRLLTAIGYAWLQAHFAIAARELGFACSASFCFLLDTHSRLLRHAFRTLLIFRMDIIDGGFAVVIRHGVMAFDRWNELNWMGLSAYGRLDTGLVWWYILVIAHSRRRRRRLKGLLVQGNGTI